MNTLLLCLSLGACLSSQEIQFRLFSKAATRVEVCLFSQAINESEKVCLPLERERRSEVWALKLPLPALRPHGLASPFESPLYYGYRVWGPNWPYHPDWKPGRGAGFVSDVDSAGNRFNPNKLLLDPYAYETSHGLEEVGDISVFTSGSQREADSAAQAPKGIITALTKAKLKVQRPVRALKDDVIYEVHVKGLTANDPSVPVFYRGTYRGAAYKAPYLRDLGVTAVEFLPVHQSVNTKGNYWGYMPLNYFSPQRSYSFDKEPGGPTREFRAMAEEFHRHGIKVLVDVVYNHTGEGGLWNGDSATADLISFRGIDNSSYYTLSRNPAHYMDHTGCGNDLAGDQQPVRDLILDSLKHWQDELGVDGFRFDLASVLGNVARGGPFYFDRGDPDNALNRARRELPVRPAAGGAGSDLIAEPWALGSGTYQQGNFPEDWAEWNGGAFRDPLRAFYNMRGVEAVTLGQVAHAVSGSPNLFESNGRRPWHSINFITAHDGFTLRDLFSYTYKRNNQAAPYGPSDGGSDNNRSWDQWGDPVRQRQMARTALVTLLMSAGTPMLVGGDEFGRTLRGNNNPYNLDNAANYLGWGQADLALAGFTRHLLGLRAQLDGLRPGGFFLGQDRNNNGLKDVSWYGGGGHELAPWEFEKAEAFLAYRIDNSEYGSGARSVLIALNAGFHAVTFRLPPPSSRSARWYRSADTDVWMEGRNNFEPYGQESRLDTTYDVQPRSAIILIER